MTSFCSKNLNKLFIFRENVVSVTFLHVLQNLSEVYDYLTVFVVVFNIQQRV